MSLWVSAPCSPGSASAGIGISATTGLAEAFCSPAHSGNKNKSSSCPSLSETVWKSADSLLLHPTAECHKKSPRSIPTHRHQMPLPSLVPSLHSTIFTSPCPEQKWIIQQNLKASRRGLGNLQNNFWFLTSSSTKGWFLCLSCWKFYHCPQGGIKAAFTAKMNKQLHIWKRAQAS